MSKELDMNNLDSIIGYCNKCEKCLRDILEQQEGTWFYSKDYYTGELQVYQDIIAILDTYKEHLEGLKKEV